MSRLTRHRSGVTYVVNLDTTGSTPSQVHFRRFLAISLRAVAAANCSSWPLAGYWSSWRRALPTPIWATARRQRTHRGGPHTSRSPQARSPRKRRQPSPGPRRPHPPARRSRAELTPHTRASTDATGSHLPLASSTTRRVIPTRTPILSRRAACRFRDCPPSRRRAQNAHHFTSALLPGLASHRAGSTTPVPYSPALNPCAEPDRSEGTTRRPQR